MNVIFIQSDQLHIKRISYLIIFTVLTRILVLKIKIKKCS